jgi:hypothetical protein
MIEVNRRQVLIFKWDKGNVGSFQFDIDTDPSKMINLEGFEFSTQILHPKNLNALAIVEGFLFDVEFLASNAKILDTNQFDFHHPKPKNSKYPETPDYIFNRFLLSLPQGSSSNLWKYLYPSMRKSGFILKVDCLGKLKFDGYCNPRIDLIKTNTI